MLAIVIPYFKINFFDATLKSLANQTNKNFKVYIGNDASKDNPEHILNTYKGSFNFEYKTFATNLGSTSLTSQWVRCIAMIQDETWISILGDDDVFGNDVVASFYNHITNAIKLNIHVIRYASTIINTVGQDISQKFTHPEIELSTEAYFKKFHLKSRSSLSEYIFSRARYNTMGFKNYPLAWHSDDKAWLDFTQGGNIYTINETTIYIRRSEFNISNKTDNLSLKNKARRLFFNDILQQKDLGLNTLQRKDFLFEYGNLIKDQHLVTFNNVFFITKQFISLGLLYDAARFLRRIFRAQLLNK